MRAFFEEYDYFILPSAQVFPFDAKTRWPREIAGRKMDAYNRWMEVMVPVTMSGCPAVILPAGFNAAGLPMGLQIMASNHAGRSSSSLHTHMIRSPAGSRGIAADAKRGAGAQRNLTVRSCWGVGLMRCRPEGASWVCSVLKGIHPRW